jgi:hypothetical protein
MPGYDTPAERIVVSIVSLRNARAGLAHVPPPHDRSTLRARIDICDELINRVGEIDRDLRQLLSDVNLAKEGDVEQLVGTHRDGGSSSVPQS